MNLNFINDLTRNWDIRRHVKIEKQSVPMIAMYVHENMKFDYI